MKNIDLNTLGNLFSSDNSYSELVAMISDMDLEFRGITLS